MLEQCQARGEIRCPDIEVAAMIVLSLTESYILSTKVLGQSEQEIARQARSIAQFVLHGIGITS
jgi:DNA-binding CsgD family transcriptional regulator